MTHSVEEFKAWLIAHNRLNAWTTPQNYLESVSHKLHWEKGITKKNLEGYFGVNSTYQEFKNDFVAWITEVDKKKETTIMVNAQEWLDKEYPLEKRATITELNFYNRKLTGELKLVGFNNLTKFNCSDNNLTNLDLTIFSKFINLEFLMLGNSDKEKAEQGIYNRFTGSLEPLKNLTKLKQLCIEGTDIDSGLEYLHDSLNEAQYDSDSEYNGKGQVFCSPRSRSDCKVAKIKEQLKPFGYNLGKWKATNKELVEKAKEQVNQINSLTKELTEIKSQKAELIAKLVEHETNLTNVHSLLDKANLELASKKQELIDLEKNYQLYEEGQNQVYQEYQKKINGLEETVKNQTIQLTTKTEELNDLKAQFGVKDETIKTKEQEITTKYQELVTKNRELDQLKADYQIQQTKITELESQLTGLALRSGLLVKQVEDLTNQLSSSQLAEQSAKLEKEIKENLLTAKENELKTKDSQISQQATKLNSYQQIIRNSEANLSKAQDIILTKTESLEKLEQERNNLEEELEKSEERITNLETTLLNSQTQINHLEIRIKDLENDNSNQTELDKLKKQLVQEQNNYQKLQTQSQQQIKQLQTELTQLKTKEAQLSLKIKELTNKQEKEQVEVKSPSLWTKIRTPLIILGGIGIIVIVYKLVRSKFKN